MITIYEPGSKNFAGNGLGALLPSECLISQIAGGSYELSLKQPMTEDLRWRLIAEECVIKAPVPADQTPYIKLYKEGTPGIPATPQRIIHRVVTGNNWSSINIYEKPDSQSRVLAILWAGMEYEYLSAQSNLFHLGTDAYNNVGYIENIYSEYVRTEPATSAGYSSVVKPRQIRNQLFRVDHVEMDSAKHEISLHAKHISYDWAGRICQELKMDKEALPAALDRLKLNLVGGPAGSLLCDFEDSVSGEWNFENAVKILLDPDEGIAAKMRCRVVRDNTDIFLLKNTQSDRRVSISYGKNMLGVKWKKSGEKLATRIVPIGKTADGKNLLLPEKYIDSAYAGQHPVIYTAKLDVPDAKVSDNMTQAQAFEAMRAAAAAEFDKGCDLVSFSLDVDFVQLGDTEEYRQYKDLQQVFLYDTVSIRHGPTGFSARAQVRSYEWDAILKRYTKVSLGDVFEVAGANISGYELPNSGIAGTKLIPGGVGSDQLRDLSVISAKIAFAAIKSANIDIAAIKRAHIADAAIDKAKIADAAIGTAQIENASVVKAKIADAAIGNAQIENASITDAKIDMANIEQLKANLINAFSARIQYLVANHLVTDDLYAALAEIATAEIETANINWASIKDLVSGRQIFEQGTGGKLYIADLAVTEANMVSLTVGELVVRGADGRFYAVGVDSEGNVQTELKQIGNGDVQDASIDGGVKLIENSITADRLNAQDIFADNALIRQLMAANIDVDTLFSRDAVINSLTLDRLKPLNDAITMEFNTVKDNISAIPKVSSHYVEYYVSDSRSELTGGAWSAAEPVIVPGKYVWSRPVTTYTNKDPDYGQPACITGAEGAPGESTYDVEIISTNGNVFRNGFVETVLRAVVYYGDEDVTDRIDANRFKWRRQSADEAEDAVWNEAHFGGTKQIVVTPEDVQYKATFFCEILKD